MYTYVNDIHHPINLFGWTTHHLSLSPNLSCFTSASRFSTRAASKRSLAKGPSNVVRTRRLTSSVFWSKCCSRSMLWPCSTCQGNVDPIYPKMAKLIPGWRWVYFCQWLFLLCGNWFNDTASPPNHLCWIRVCSYLPTSQQKSSTLVGQPQNFTSPMSQTFSKASSKCAGSTAACPKRSCSCWAMPNARRVMGVNIFGPPPNRPGRFCSKKRLFLWLFLSKPWGIFFPKMPVHRYRARDSPNVIWFCEDVQEPVVFKNQKNSHSSHMALLQIVHPHQNPTGGFPAPDAFCASVERCWRYEATLAWRGHFTRDKSQKWRI